MAYPILQTANTSSLEDNVSATTRSVTLPSGLSSGDLILIVFHSSDAGAPTTVQLTTNMGVFTVASTGSLSGVSNRYGIFYKWSDGTESGGVITASLANSASIATSVYSCYRITGADSSKSPTVQFTTGSINSASITAGWGGGENLFLSIVSHVQSGAPTVSSYPSGYTSGTNYRLTNGLIAQASKQSTSATDDAGTYTLSYSGTRSFSLAVVVGAGAPPAIDSINGGSPVKAGQTGIAIALSNFISTPNSVTCTYESGAKSLSVSSISGNNTAITVNLEDRSEAADYPLLGASLLFTVSDGVGTDTDTSTLAAKTGETSVTFVNIIDQYDTFFAYHFAAAGFTSEGAEFTYSTTGFSPADFVLNADSSFSSTFGGVVSGWLRPATGTGAGNVYYYQFTISDGGEITVATGLTRAGLTTAGLTKSGLTTDGL